MVFQGALATHAGAERVVLKRVKPRVEVRSWPVDEGGSKE
jgi:hypothetical protein